MLPLGLSWATLLITLSQSDSDIIPTWRAVVFFLSDKISSGFNFNSVVSEVPGSFFLDVISSIGSGISPLISYAEVLVAKAERSEDFAVQTSKDLASILSSTEQLLPVNDIHNSQSAQNILC